MNKRITRQEVNTLREKLSSLVPELMYFELRLRNEGFSTTAIDIHELEYKLTRLSAILMNNIILFPTEKEANNVCK